MLPAKLLDEGFGSLVLEAADGVVFRVARTAEAAAGHDRERALLPILRGRLPVELPLPEWHVAPQPSLLFGALGHRKLAGRKPAAGELDAAEVAAFLRQLHAVDVGLRRRAPFRDQILALRDLLPVVAERLSPDERRALAAWWHDAAGDERMTPPRMTLVHGDAWYGNMLVDGSPPRLAAVLDWSNAAIGDPAEDLAPQFYLGDDFARAVLDAYGADDALRHRVTRYRVLREFGGVRWSLEQGDEEELEESVAKLRRVVSA